MKSDKMQASQFELKYFLTEDTARRMRPFVQGYIAQRARPADRQE